MISDTLDEDLEFLRTTYKRNMIKTSKSTKQEESIEVQACSGSTSRSIICNALFPELKESQRRATETTPKQSRINYFDSNGSSSSSSGPLRSLFTPMEKSSRIQNKSRFPTSILQKGKSAYYRGKLFDEPMDRFPVDVSFTTRSLNAMSVDSDDDEDEVIEKKPEEKRSIFARNNQRESQFVLKQQPKSKLKNQSIFGNEFLSGDRGFADTSQFLDCFLDKNVVGFFIL